MSQTQGSPAKVSGGPAEDEVEAWGNLTDDNLKNWGMAPEDVAAVPEAGEEHARPDAAEVPAGDVPPTAAAQPTRAAREGNAPVVSEQEPVRWSVEETADHVVDGPAGTAPQNSPTAVWTRPDYAPAGTGTGPIPDAELAAVQPLTPEQPGPPVAALHGGDDDTPLPAETFMLRDNGTVAAEAPALAGPTVEQNQPEGSTQSTPPPAQNHPTTLSVGRTPLPTEPLASAVRLRAARETGPVDTARNRRGKPVLLAASAAGVLLIGMPLLFVDRGAANERQASEQSGIPAGTVLNLTNPETGNVVTNAPPSPGTGKHRGTAAKNEKSPTTQVSPSTLLQQRTPAKHATTSSSTQHVAVRSTQKNPSGASPTAGAGNTTSASTHPSSKPSTKPDAPATTVVRATRVLTAGQSWSATLARMTMRSDGNLVIYDEQGHIRWAANTSGANNRAVFQADGNLVVYNSANQALWTSGSAGHNGAELVLQDDGNVVISLNGTAFWSSRTEH